MMHALTRVLLAEPPLDPSAEEGRRLAEQELAKSEYHQPSSVLDHLRSWFHQQLPQVDGPRVSSPNPTLGTIIMTILALALVALIVVVLVRLRRDPALTKPEKSVFDGEELLPAVQYRSAAEDALRRGDWGAAVVLAFRAITASAAERTLLDDAPALTAHEVGATLVAPFPAEAESLARAADHFDWVRYGDGQADEPMARGMLDLDSRLLATRPRYDQQAADSYAGSLVPPGHITSDPGNGGDA